MPAPKPARARAVDWKTIYEHLAQTSARLGNVEDESPEMLERAWERRAAQLARHIEEDDSGEKSEVIIVRVARELYGIEVPFVRDIRPQHTLTRVPRVPGWVAGVVNLRGRILSVINLALFLGLPIETSPENSPKYLLVVETPAMEIALQVDDVLVVEPVALNQLQEASSAVRGIRPEFVRGLLLRDPEKKHNENDMLVLLDLPALLADPTLLIHEEI